MKGIGLTERLLYLTGSRFQLKVVSLVFSIAHFKNENAVTRYYNIWTKMYALN